MTFKPYYNLQMPIGICTQTPKATRDAQHLAHSLLCARRREAVEP